MYIRLLLSFMVLGIIAGESSAHARSSHMICENLRNDLNSKIAEEEKEAANSQKEIDVSAPAVTYVSRAGRPVMVYCVTITVK